MLNVTTAIDLLNKLPKWAKRKFHERIGQCLKENWDDVDIANKKIEEIVADNKNIAAVTPKKSDTAAAAVTATPSPDATNVDVQEDEHGSDDGSDDGSDKGSDDEGFIPDELYDSDQDSDYSPQSDSDDDCTLSPFCDGEDEYDLDDKDDEKDEDDDTPPATATEEQRSPARKKQKRRKKKGGSKLAPKRKGGRKGPAYVPKERDTGESTDSTVVRKRTAMHKQPASGSYIEYDAKENMDRIDKVEQRLLISYYFVHVLDAPPPNEWGGVGGTVAEIVRALNFPNKHRKVQTVLEQTWGCMQSNIHYMGRTTQYRGGQKQTIQPGSAEEQMIAKYKEDGCSFTHITDFVNDARGREGLLPVTRSAIYWYYMNQMKKIITPLNKRCQGNSDANSDWARARYRWVTQLLIRMGEKPDLSDFIPTEEGTTICDALNADKLQEGGFMFNQEQVAYFDEVHKQCHIGDKREGAQEHVQFPRDAEGNYDPVNGTYSEEGAKGFVMHVKYAKEVRFCFGVAIVNGEGKRLDAFDYSAKKILSILDYEAEIKKEIRRVRGLKKGTAPWYESGRHDGAVYCCDKLLDLGSRKLKKVSGLGKKTYQKLIEDGYETVNDVKTKMDDDAVHNLVQTKRYKLEFLQQLRTACEPAIDEVPTEVEHTLAANPYESKYGEQWREKIAETSALSGFVCITSLVKYMMEATAKAYKGTEYEDSWLVYHDALSLMCAKDCKEWMKAQFVDEEKKVSYYDKWILPVFGLNDEFSQFKDRPIGNSPEMMPLDNCLNKDLHEAVSRHVLMSRAAAKNKKDPRIFSLATPKEGARAYQRVWDTAAPSSKRIVQDIKKVVSAMHQIHKSKGAFVPDLAQRPGDRHIVNELKSKIWGGKRTRKEVETMLFADRDDLHEDLKSILAERDL